ncbi:hypothetical protein Lal_00031956 [Lupinus albus]|nr:hypothetical protein Lal_00031956 [Lupinus albus]
MRTEMRRSQDEMEASFNHIYLNKIFQEDDPLSEWIEERENPSLNGAQNVEWLPIIDTNDENKNMEVDSGNIGSDENSCGLRPPSDDGGNGGGHIEARVSDDEELSRNLGKEKRKNITLDDASSSSLAQSFMSLYASGQFSPYRSSSIDYQEPYYQQSSNGFFCYVFGQRATRDGSRDANEDYAPPRHSNMWDVMSYMGILPLLLNVVFHDDENCNTLYNLYSSK